MNSTLTFDANRIFLVNVCLNPFSHKFFGSKWFKYIILAFAATILVVFPAIAQSSDIMQAQLDQMRSTQAWWDKIWQETYDPVEIGGVTLNSADYIFSTVVRWIFQISVLFFVIRFILMSGELSDGNLATFTIKVAPMLLSFFCALVLLGNNGLWARAIPLTMRGITNFWRNGMMEVRIVDLTAKEAFDDIFATKEVQNQIYLQAQQCALLQPPAIGVSSDGEKPLNPSELRSSSYIQCLDRLLKVAKDAESTCPIINTGNCGPMFRNFMETTVKSLTASQERAKKAVESGDIFSLSFARDEAVRAVSGLAATAGAKPLFTSMQWAFINALEMGLWLDGLIAPIAVALMFVPGKLNLFVVWAISIGTFVLAQIMYTLIAGINALLIASTAIGSGDLNFEMALGVFAPLMTLAILVGGGFAGAQSFTAQSTAVVAAGIGALSGSISSAVSRLSASRRW